MEWWSWVLVFLAVVLCIVVFGRDLFLRRSLEQREDELAELDAEEHRMLDFLHHLGSSIAAEQSLQHLHRTIVEGIDEVVAADGTVLYLLENNELVPGYISEKAPALVRLPEEVASAGEKEQRQWLRLASISSKDELLGDVIEYGAAVFCRGNQKCQFSERLPDGIRHLLAMPLSHGGRIFGVLASVRKERDFTENDWDVFRSAAEQSAYGLGNALLHREVQEKRRIESELRTARKVQNILLPEKAPDWPGYRIECLNRAARLISGDYFDFFEVGEKQRGVVIADVSGKGVGAGLVMAGCRSALRAYAGGSDRVKPTLSALNRQVFSDVREDMFVSAAYLVIEEESGRVELGRAGHDAPLLYRKATGEVERLKPGGLALGIDEGNVFERVLKPLEFTLEEGDVLLLYTDGLNEAENRKGEEYGLDRVKADLSRLGSEGAKGVLEGLTSELADFVDGHNQSDDLTLVVLERQKIS